MKEHKMTVDFQWDPKDGFPGIRDSSTLARMMTLIQQQAKANGYTVKFGPGRSYADIMANKGSVFDVKENG